MSDRHIPHLHFGLNLLTREYRVKSKAKKTASKKVATKKKVTPKKAATKKTAAKAKVTPKKKPVARKSSAPPRKTKKKVATKKSKAPTKKASTTKSQFARLVGNDNTSSLNFTPYKQTRGEEYMNDNQVEHFRAILHIWKKQLMEEVDRTLNHMQDEAANFPDPNDRATQESEFTLELRTRDRERKLIKKIDEAIATLDTGEYGYCEECGIEIGVRRLEARPTATLCIDCKVLDEIRERQMG